MANFWRIQIGAVLATNLSLAARVGDIGYNAKFVKFPKSSLNVLRARRTFSRSFGDVQNSRGYSCILIFDPKSPNSPKIFTKLWQTIRGFAKFWSIAWHCSPLCRQKHETGEQLGNIWRLIVELREQFSTDMEIFGEAWLLYRWMLAEYSRNNRRKPHLLIQTVAKQSPIRRLIAIFANESAKLCLPNDLKKSLLFIADSVTKL